MILNANKKSEPKSSFLGRLQRNLLRTRCGGERPLVVAYGPVGPYGESILFMRRRVRAGVLQRVLMKVREWIGITKT